MPRFLECECAEIGGHPTWANKLSKRKENEKLAGVYPNGGRFRAEHPSGGKLISLGSYDTAVEAAVAVAKYAGGAEPEDEVVVVDGYTLLRSRNSSTGYVGVYPDASTQGRFRACHGSGGRQ